MKQIGILGGTFDPPHLGHFIIADETKHKLKLDEIWFIPTNEPPHKKRAASSNEHRVNMLNIVINEIDYFKINTIEIKRSGKSYTIDTINEFQNQYPDHQFYFIIGADMVEYLPNWKQIDELSEKVKFVGVNRPGFTLKTQFPITKMEAPLISISSTDIKHRIIEGMPVHFLLPEKVLAYIKEHRLYEST